jgi:hypothetical protein
LIEKLPVTADGARVVPMRDTVFTIRKGEVFECRVDRYVWEENEWVVKPFQWDQTCYHAMSDCYSTEAAALAARGTQ